MAGPETTERLVGDRYALEDPLGRGGMGVVWRAYDNLLKRKVAIKEIRVPAGLPAGERSAIEKRVLREARTAAGLSHPSVVGVYDVIQDEGRAYIVMELVEAPTLYDLVEGEGALLPERAAEIGLDILSALEVAHAKGIVHRDVKPGNVMVPANGPAKLADFGIATVTGDPKLTATGMILGSPSFMAPEQARDVETSPATDLWALGGVLYYAVEGKPPFDKGQPIPTLTAVLNEEPEQDIAVEGALASAIRAALTKEPERRPTTSELRALLSQEDTVPAPPITLPRTDPVAPHPRERRQALTFVAAGLGALLLAGGAWFLLSRGEEPKKGAGGTEQTGDAPAPENEIPADFTKYEDDAIGYTVAYPSGWTISDPGTSNSTDFRDEATGTYLRVDWVQPPNGTPEGAWEYASTHNSFGDYQEIRIEPTTYKGMDAALWEYTYSDDGAELRAYNLGFITPDGATGMALNFQTHEEDWAASQPLWTQLKASFEPPK